MTPKESKLLADALGLPQYERADLAARLIDSLDQTFDQDAGSAWDAEVARRISDLDSGLVELIPWPEARRMILGTPDGASET